MRITKRIALVGVSGIVACLPALAGGSQKPTLLSQRLAEAKTIFVTCPGGACEASVQRTAYKTLTLWGKYTVVESRENADLILMFSWDNSQDLGEYLGTLPSGGAVFVPIHSTWWHAQIIDSRDNKRLWEESMEYAGSPQSTTRFLIHKLKRRVSKM
jgi:hypothetical protein